MEAREKVLVIDDEPEILNFVAQILSRRYQVLLASNSEEGARIAQEQNPATILIDILMPNTDGVSACERIRRDEATRLIPVIMLTAMNDPEHRIKAFQAGADDFVGKPFHPEELLSRVDSKIRRFRETDSENAPKRFRIVRGNLEIDIANLSVTIAGRQVNLGPLEFQLLRQLAENPGKLLTRRELIQKVWNGEAATDRVIDPHMTSLRKRLTGFDHAIHTVYGSGYILKPIPKA